MFNGPVVTDYFGDNGRPLFTTTGALLGIDKSTLRLNRLFHKYLSNFLPVIIAGLFILIIFLCIRFFIEKKRNRTERGNTGSLISIMLLILFAGITGGAHILIFRITSIISSLGTALMQKGYYMDIVLMIIAAVIYAYYLAKYRAGKKITMILTANAFLMLATGLILFNKAMFEIKIIFLTAMLHGILAVTFTGIFCLSVYLKLLSTPNSDGLSSVKKFTSS